MNKIKEFLKFKKAQLGIIEFKFLMIGLVIGIILTAVLIYLGAKGVKPFGFLKFLCPTTA
jgi:hypothetical protein